MTRRFDPVTPGPGDDHLLREEYLDRHAPSAALGVFYRIKPAIPRSVQIALRRRLARRQARRDFPAWPVETVLLGRRAQALAEELGSAGAERLRVINPWPDGHEFAVILTHDVEGPLGLERMDSLLELEMQLQEILDRPPSVISMPPHEEVTRPCLGQISLQNLFQNSIDFTQREYRFAIFKCELIRAEGFLRRLNRL